MKPIKQLAMSLVLLTSMSFSLSAQEGTLMILKTKTMLWGKQEMPVHLNKVHVGTLPSDTKLELKLKPGRYVLQSQSPMGSNEVNVDITDGATTYISATVFVVGNPSIVNTNLAVVSENEGKRLMSKMTDANHTIEGAGSYNQFTPNTMEAAAPPEPAQTTAATGAGGGKLMAALMQASGAAPAAATPPAQSNAAPSKTNPDGTPKTEEQLKQEAVDGFTAGLDPINIKEVIANNSRQKELVAIGDLYDFSSTDEGESETKQSTYSAMDFEAPPKLEKEFPNLKYRRSSVYTLIVNDTTRAGYGHILSAFGDSKLPEKFNNHNVGEYLIEGEGGSREEEAQIANINAYLEENQVAKKMVAKWFNRSASGGFNMDLIAQRGFYNATELDVTLAKSSQRGLALLADAGEELIKNSFVLVNDYNFTNKEEVAKKVGGAMKLGAFVAAASGNDQLADGLKTASEVVDFVGKGFVIRTRTYLYQLEWNEDVANQFYNQHWTTDDNLDGSKVNAFNASDIFKLKLVGYQTATADLQSTKATTKTDAELIRIATVKAQDKAVAKLEKTYEQFRTKTPLYSVEPLAAKIGLKEDIQKNDKFEVLEQVIDKDGKTEYKKIGIIVVDGSNIWDNTFGADEDPAAQQGVTYTTFKGNNKGMYEGMLIRQIN